VGVCGETESKKGEYGADKKPVLGVSAVGVRKEMRGPAFKTL